MESYKKKIKEAAFSYVPELYWHSGKKDIGTALLLLGGMLLEESAEKVKRLPEKHKAEFYNLFEKPAPLENFCEAGVYAQIKTDSEIALKKETEFCAYGSVFRLTEDFKACAAEIESITLADPDNCNFSYIYDGERFYNDFEAEKAVCRLLFPVGNFLYGLGEGGFFFLADAELDTIKALADTEAVVWSVGGNTLKVEMSCGQIKLTGEFQPNGNEYEVCAEIKNINRFAGQRFEKPIFTADGEGLKPDMIVRNGEAVNQAEEFYPFGCPIEEKSEFYISCETAFSKKRARIAMRFYIYTHEQCFSFDAFSAEEFEAFYGKKTAELIKKNLPKEKVCVVEKVGFSYFNGEGFVPLPNCEKYGGIFNGSRNGLYEMSFIMPDDAESFAINGARRFWIRIKLAECGDLYYRPCKMRCPLIRDIQIDCKCSVLPEKPLRLIMDTNGERAEDLNGVVCENPYDNRYIYIKIKSGISENISIYFRRGSDNKRIVYGGWEIKTSEGFITAETRDGTDGLTYSGIISFVVPYSVREQGMILLRARVMAFGEMLAANVNSLELVYNRNSASGAEFIPVGTALTNGDINISLLENTCFATDKNVCNHYKNITLSDGLITEDDIRTTLFARFPAIAEIRFGTKDNFPAVCIRFKDYTRQNELFDRHKHEINGILKETKITLVRPQPVFMRVRAKVDGNCNLCEIEKKLSIFLGREAGKNIGELPTEKEVGVFFSDSGVRAEKIAVTATVYSSQGQKEYNPKELTGGFYLSEAGECVLKEGENTG